MNCLNDLGLNGPYIENKNMQKMKYLYYYAYFLKSIKYIIMQKTLSLHLGAFVLPSSYFLRRTF